MPRTKAFDPDAALESAMKLFLRKGYSATSIQELLQAMGINRSSLYDTFGNKDEVFHQALEHYLKTSGSASSAGTVPVKTFFRRMLYGLLDRYVGSPDMKGCLVMHAATELEMLPQNSQYRIQEVLRGHVQNFENRFQRAKDQGEISSEPRVVAVMMLSTMVSLDAFVRAKLPPEEMERLIEGSLSAIR